MTWPREQPTLACEELILTALHPTDAADIHLACQDPAIQHFTQVPVPYEMQDAESFITGSAHGWQSAQTAVFAVRFADKPRLLGAVSIMEVDWTARSAEVGYWTAPWARGQGITARAVQCATDWALAESGLVRLVAEAEGVNAVSSRVLAKTGFHQLPGERIMELKGTMRTFTAWERPGP